MRFAGALLAIAIAIAVACGCGGGAAPAADVAIEIDWSPAAGTALSPGLLGHNTVWSRGGLGLYDDAAGAVRPEAEAAVRALAPGALRFPGGTRAMRYHFDEVIGPAASRVPQCDTFTGALDDTGWGLDEFLAFAEAQGAEVTLVSTWVDGSPEETAAMIAYANAEPGSTVPIGVDVRGKDWGSAGDWAARRVANGRAAPWGVRYLEVGNEPYLSQTVGPAESCGRPSRFRQSERWIDDSTVIPTTAADYAAELAKTAALVRAVDPTVLIGAAAFSAYDGATDAAAELGDVDRETMTGDAWNARLVADAGDAFDFFVLHPYDFSTTDSRSRLADRLRKVIRDLRALAPDKGVAITEYGFLIGGATLRSGLLAADVVRVAAEEGALLALRHVLIEDDPSGPFAESAAILGPERTKTPGYLAMELLAGALGGGEASATWHPVSGAPDDLGLLAARVGGGGVAIVLVDRRVDAIEPRSVELPLPPDSAWTGEAATLTGAHLDVVAGEASVTRAPIAADARGRLRVSVPASALVVVTLALTP